MKWSLFAIAAIGLSASVALTFVGNSNAELTAEIVENSSADASQQSEPKIPDGPYPVSVVEDPAFDFGSMLVGETKSHGFIVRNTGTAPLEFGEIKTSCKCTVGSLPENQLPPGESVDIALEWTPEKVTQNFQQVARIETNDPVHPVIQLTVTGKVTDLYIMQPPHTWALGALSTTEPNTATGLLYSPVREQFSISEIIAPHDALSVTADPLSDEELIELDAQSGYRLTVTLNAEELPRGKFLETFELKTDLGDELEPAWMVSGTVAGPIRFSGNRWSQQDRRQFLGKFPAADGWSQQLMMFAEQDAVAHNFAVINCSSDRDYVTVKAEPVSGSNLGNLIVYRLSISVPPLQRDAMHDKSNPVTVTIQTNDAHNPVEEFELTFHAY